MRSDRFLKDVYYSDTYNTFLTAIPGLGCAPMPRRKTNPLRQELERTAAKSLWGLSFKCPALAECKRPPCLRSVSIPFAHLINFTPHLCRLAAAAKLPSAVSNVRVSVAAADKWSASSVCNLMSIEAIS
jgi:hypothetical protein